MKKYQFLFYTIALTGLLTSCGGSSEPKTVTSTPDEKEDSLFLAKVGEPLPAWTPGTLDVHSISTGRGESFLYIMPDGTTMIIDAGGSLITEEVVAKDPDQTAAPLAARPSLNISSSTVIANYVKHFNPNGNKVDYWLNSHFDTDHMGNFPETYAAISSLSKSITKHSDGDFYLNGINELGTLLDFKKIIDRGYTTPIDRSGEKRFKDYIRFLKWTKSTKGTIYETAKVGHNDQLVLNYSPTLYPDFKIRILCGGAYYWTGTGEEKKTYLPLNADGTPDVDAIKSAGSKENIYSIAIMLDWGKFNLFSGGDLQYNNRSVCSWFDAETPLCNIVHEVEVMKANHHGSKNANSYELLSKLSPKTLLLTPWRGTHPKIEALADIVKASPLINIFATGVARESRTAVAEYADRFKAWDGHIVLRVAKDGQYKIFSLDDTNEQYRVKGIFGAYQSK